MKRTLLIPIFLAAAMLLSACGLSEADLQATVTQAVGDAVTTVHAQYTQVALLTPSPTNTEPPTSTPDVTETPLFTPTSPAAGGAGTGTGGTCDVMGFLADVTVSDGEEIAANTPFTKTWQVRNAGTCEWSTSYTLIYSSGDQMGGTSGQPLSVAVPSGGSTEISVTLTAPATAGDYTGWWALANASGQAFGYLSVVIKVP
ncbi:MAG: hypothetical protein KIT46_09320 [Anaerolineales bacterium]|nr:hypothetical protein [Anaerolineales bacterium]MCW5856230.1 hypothetical protein [Anaerolineales bacterium]